MFPFAVECLARRLDACAFDFQSPIFTCFAAQRLCGDPNRILCGRTFLVEPFENAGLWLHVFCAGAFQDDEWRRTRFDEECFLHRPDRRLLWRNFQRDRDAFAASRLHFQDFTKVKFFFR